MFCPECGIEELNPNQFCRACGTDLRRVRLAVESTDSVTTSAVSAREDIGRAVAAKIRETQSASELKQVAEDVLPEIEKFLESPEEKRLRRIRSGTVLSSIGMGTAIGMTLISYVVNSEDLLVLAGLALIVFFIGLGLIINGIFLSLPKKTVADRSLYARIQHGLDQAAHQTADVRLPEFQGELIPSVTEHTTRHLKEQ